MNKLLLGGILIIAYFAQSAYVTSERNITRFIHDFSLLSTQDPTQACEKVSDKVDVSIRQTMSNGTWEVEGGKDELCGFMKKGNATMVLLEGNLSWQFENIKIKSSFPWQKATTSYDEISEVNISKVGAFKSVMHYQLELKRTLTGKLEIVKVHANGGSQ